MKASLVFISVVGLAAAIGGMSISAWNKAVSPDFTNPPDITPLLKGLPEEISPSQVPQWVAASSMLRAISKSATKSEEPYKALNKEGELLLLTEPPPQPCKGLLCPPSHTLGAYQITSEEWEDLHERYKLWHEGLELSGVNQDLAMLRLLDESEVWKALMIGAKPSESGIHINKISLKIATYLASRKSCYTPYSSCDGVITPTWSEWESYFAN